MSGDGGVTRRQALGLAGAALVLPALDWSDAQAERATRMVQRAAVSGAQSAEPKFFSAEEWETVNMLVDYIIPKDDRSGSATEAKVPEFMDFMMIEQPARQVAMRGGLAWLDVECQERFDKTFLDCSEAERFAVLDDIAWPAKAKPEFAHGVAFFTSFRDLTAAGFWTTRTGIDDLQYLGNRSVARWNGCPDAALKKLGVSYD